MGIVPSSQMPELSIVDYMLWALNRYICQGEIRFWETVERKVSSVVDVYDQPDQRKNVYNGDTDLFRLEKASPFFGQ